MAEDSSDKPKEDNNSDVTEFKGKSFGENVRELTGNLAKHYDRVTAKSDDKKIQEIEADKAEVASLGESTKEANENQLTRFIDMKDLKYTNSEAPLDTLDQSERSTE